MRAPWKTVAVPLSWASIMCGCEPSQRASCAIPYLFWGKIDRLPTVQGEIPESAREAIEHLLPESGMQYRLARRRAGMGSLGTNPSGRNRRMEGRTRGPRGEGAHRFGSALVVSRESSRGDLVRCNFETSGSLSRSLCPDAGTLDREAAVSVLFANRIGGARDQPRRMPIARSHGKRDGEHPFRDRREAPGYPQGFARAKRELACRISASDGGCHGKGLERVESALAKLDFASASLQ